MVRLPFVKITFGFGFSFGKPVWIIPSLILIINDQGEYRPQKILDFGGGWLLCSVKIQILYGG